MALDHFPRDANPHDVGEHILRHGYAIVDDLADEPLLTALDAEAAPYIDASSHGRDEYDGRYTRRTGALIARCPSSRALVMHPTVVGAVQRVMSQATTVQLHLTQIISIAPGETQQKLHRDQMAFDFYPFPPDYHVQCNTMWALTDFTVENGATHICPDTSALADIDAREVASEQATMRRGSCLFYDGKVLHGGGANVGTSERRGVNVTYAVGWVRQEENQYLATPLDVARTLDDDLLRMMGYQPGAFALGYVGDQQDPLSMLRGHHAKVRNIGEMVQNNDDIRTFVDELRADQGRDLVQ